MFGRITRLQYQKRLRLSAVPRSVKPCNEKRLLRTARYLCCYFASAFEYGTFENTSFRTMRVRCTV